MATNNREANGEASNRPPPFPIQQQVNQLEVPQLNMLQYLGQARQFSPNLGIENVSMRAGIPTYHPQVPPIPPFLQTPFGGPPNPNHPVGQQNVSTINLVRSHTRSVSQPVAFSMDSLPPLSPSLHKPDNVFMDEKSGSSLPFLPTTPFTRGSSSIIGESLPPRKTHRRSISDIPFRFSSASQSPAPGMPLRSPGALDRSVSAREISAKPAQLVLKGAESNMQNPGVYLSSEMREGLQSDAFGDIASTTQHHRSVSMDCLMGNINYTEDSFGVLPSSGATSGQLSQVSSIDANSDAFSLEFGNGEFSSDELQKIMSNEKLTEIAMTDPKRVKRLLANRQSAARSKERKMRYTAELEHKVLTLQSEATSLSTQLTELQREHGVLRATNHELRIRLQSMEQQAQLRDALNRTLVAEVQHLRNATGFPGGFQQLSISSQSSERTLSNVHHSQQQYEADSMPQTNGDAAASP